MVHEKWRTIPRKVQLGLGFTIEASAARFDNELMDFQSLPVFHCFEAGCLSWKKTSDINKSLSMLLKDFKSGVTHNHRSSSLSDLRHFAASSGVNCRRNSENLDSPVDVELPILDAKSFREADFWKQRGARIDSFDSQDDSERRNRLPGGGRLWETWRKKI